MNKDSKIYLAGHAGMAGSAIYRKLKNEGYTNIVTRTHKELDLTNQQQTQDFFQKERPEYVILAAAKVGGIKAHMTYPADFAYINIMIESNVIKASYNCGVKRLLFLGSSCIYPRLCPQPIKEEYLLTGPLEPTNEAYAIAKIAGLKMCQYFNSQYGTNFISVTLSNLYGPNDNFDLETSSVLPALLRKFHEAKTNKQPYVEVWGTGNQRREFLHVDDLADAVLHLMNNYKENEPMNVGTGEDISIKELAELIKEIVGYEGEIRFDTTKPDGILRRLLDVSRLHSTGWKHKIDLREGIQNTYEWYKTKKEN
jgi:GDP-L-fucose synthase